MATKAAKKFKPSKAKKKAKPKAAEPIPAKQLRFKAPAKFVEGLQWAKREARAYWARVPEVSTEDRAALDRMMGAGMLRPQPIKKKRKRPIGAPREYKHDEIRAAATEYITRYGCPRSNLLLCEKVADVCKEKGILVPEMRWLQHLVSPVFKRFNRPTRG